MIDGTAVRERAWPELPWLAWGDTLATLHMWTQIVGKLRLAAAAPESHWWHAPLYVTARGLTTSAMPYGERLFVQPRIAGHGPTLYQSGLPSTRRLELVSATPFRCGAVAMQYRRER